MWFSVLGRGTGHQKAVCPLSTKPQKERSLAGAAGSRERKRGGDGRAPPLVFLLGSQARGEVGKALPGIINRLSIKDLIYSSI